MHFPPHPITGNYKRQITLTCLQQEINLDSVIQLSINRTNIILVVLVSLDRFMIWPLVICKYQVNDLGTYLQEVI